jgi:hypothetical protein
MYKDRGGIRMKKRLKKDIVIKAGTVFDCIDGRKTQYNNGNYSKLFGLTKNSYGEVIYSMDKDDKNLDEWFDDVEE